MITDGKRIPAVVSLTLTLFLCVCQLHGQPISELVVFGDSHSDTGNWLLAFDYPTPPHYAEGRDSNGPLWVEWLAETLNLALPTPSTGGGLDYAFGGATTETGIEEFQQYRIPRLGEQVERHLQEHEPNINTLYVLFAGHNDFGFFQQSNPSMPASNISSYVRNLAVAGGHHFMVPNLHPLGHLPAYRGSNREATLNQLTDDFNLLLDDELIGLETEMGIELYRPDFHGLVQQAIVEPGSLGLVNSSDPAIVGGVPVERPDEYVYWDGNHFTTAFHRLMAERAALTLADPLSAADFNDDGDLDYNDADALVGEIVAGTNDLSFDLSGDEVVDKIDLTQWLTDAAMKNGFNARYVLGDANLDGSVDATDLNNLALNWRKTENVALWSAGDFTADGNVNAADLNDLALNWRQSIPFAATSETVPEPTTFTLICGIMATSLLRRRRTKFLDG